MSSLNKGDFIKYLNRDKLLTSLV